MAGSPVPPHAQSLLEAQYDNMLACIRCGLCHSVCPTYQESFVEPEGPRGRIAIARALTEGHLTFTADLLAHWENCILCDACSAVCPSGVHMEPIGQAVRAAAVEAGVARTGRLLKAVLGWALPDMARLRWLAGAARFYQRWGLRRVARGSGALTALGLARADALLPDLDGTALIPEGQVWEPRGEHRATVALLAGCVMSAVFSATDEATARVLAANGCRVIVPAGQGCCGALHAHRGERERAQDLARRNIEAFEQAGVDAIVVNAAGCGAAMKAYGDLLADDPAYALRAKALSARVKDFSEFLVGLGVRTPACPVPMRVTYQEPCHLVHAQRIREAPRALLHAVPGLELVEMAEPSLCCGAGAMYNVTNPCYSERLRDRKVRNARATEAEAVVTANPGCLLQLRQGLREAGSSLPVLHIADLLDQAYRGDPVPAVSPATAR